MNADFVINLLSSTAFPIVACVALAWYINKQSLTISAFTKSIDKLSRTLEKALEKLTKEN